MNGAPEHVTYALLEANSPSAVARFVTQIPFKNDFKVTPVEHIQDTMEMAKAMMAQR